VTDHQPASAKIKNEFTPIFGEDNFCGHRFKTNDGIM
jgi:hypothetical protein